MLDLVGNPNRWISHAKAYLLILIVQKVNFSMFTNRAEEMVMLLAK